jgi:hypothetical protein
MAKFVLTDARFEIGGTDLSDHVESITLNYESDTPETTAMGDGTHIFAGGLKNWSVDISFRQDLAASEVDATFFPLVGTTAAIKIRNSATNSVSATNPSYEGTALVASYQPIGNAVGETANAPVKLMCAGTLSRATS